MKWMRLQEPLFLWRKQINVMRKRLNLSLDARNIHRPGWDMY